MTRHRLLLLVILISETSYYFQCLSHALENDIKKNLSYQVVGQLLYQEKFVDIMRPRKSMAKLNGTFYLSLQFAWPEKGFPLERLCITLSKRRQICYIIYMCIYMCS